MTSFPNRIAPQNFNVTTFSVSGYPGSVILFHEDESEMSITEPASYSAFNIISFYLIKSPFVKREPEFAMLLIR
jgi:hypothetical protein